MDNFVYEYKTKVYFGKGAAKKHLAKALAPFGKNIMLTYGGSSIKRNGIFNEIAEILKAAGKKRNGVRRHYVKSDV